MHTVVRKVIASKETDSVGVEMAQPKDELTQFVEQLEKAVSTVKTIRDEASSLIEDLLKKNLLGYAQALVKLLQSRFRLNEAKRTRQSKSQDASTWRSTSGM